MMTFFRKLIWLARWRRKEDDLAAELEFHLDSEAAERQAEGLPAHEAVWAARRDLGNLAGVREQTRSAWSWSLVEQIGQDARYALRTTLHSPTFTILAALSLALGIGANTAIYSFMDALLMRSLPVENPSALVILKWRITGKKNLNNSVVHDVTGSIADSPQGGSISGIFPYPAFQLLQKSDVLSVLFAYHPARKLNVIAQGQAEIMSGEYVSGDFFRGLGTIPAAGRLITSDDDLAGSRPVLVLSHGFAQSRFGDAGRAVGKTVLINNTPFVAIGVTSPDFFGVDPSKSPDVYLPFHADLVLNPERNPGGVGRYVDEHYYWTEMMGRLRPRVTVAQAQAALAPLFQNWVTGTVTKQVERSNLPEFVLESGAAGLDNLRRGFSGPLYILLAMVGLILAIACANIANLLLARATARRREMAIRLSVGASRGRVIRQLLTESLLLAALGGAAGILFAVWGIRFLTAVLAAGTDNFTMHAELNTNVLVASSLLTMIAGLLFGLAPALEATRVDPMLALKETRAGAPRLGRRFGFSLGRMLVIAQMAICLLLLVGAGLFVRTLTNLHKLDVGFERESMLLFKVNARQAGYRNPQILSFYSNLEKRLASIAGVRRVTLANSPLIGDGAFGWPVIPVGKPKPEHAPSGHGSGTSRTATRVLGSGPGFFSTMHIPLVAGRDFDQRDRLGAPPVAIVNEAWAKVNLDGQNPIGQEVTSYSFLSPPQEMEIIGLAKNARYDDLTGDFPSVVYLPYEQNFVPVDEMTFFLRTTGNPLQYAAAVRDIVRQADSRIPVAGLSTQVAQIDREMIPETLFARLCTAFAILALSIACVGLYATTSYTVARRTSEIGIRMALGAPRATVVWMVLRDVLILSLLGLALSLPASMAVSKLVESLLFGVQPNDPRVLAAAVGILLSAALAAGYVPARKALRIDPMTAVRQE